MILTPLQKLPKNGENWGKLIVAKGFKKLPKVQNITQSGHTGKDFRILQQHCCSIQRSKPKLRLYNLTQQTQPKTLIPMPRKII